MLIKEHFIFRSKNQLRFVCTLGLQATVIFENGEAAKSDLGNAKNGLDNEMKRNFDKL